MSIFVPPAVTKEYRKERKEHPHLSHETLMRIARDHMKCPPDLQWECKQGVKEYIQRQTRKRGPYYALITGALHGAPADYTVTQPYVERIVEAGPEAWLDVEKVRKFLNTPLRPGTGGRPKRYQFSRQRAPVVVEMTKCYLQNKDNPIVCAEPRKVKGIGLKGSQLIREYLGDENAVAVDRHVFDYICRREPEWCKEVKKRLRPTSHGISIPEDIQQEVADKVRALAFEYGKTPADIQTAAWLKGACEARRRARHVRKKFVWLGPDKIIHCVFQEGRLPPARRIRRAKPPRGVLPLSHYF